jgi:hypothetical protein
MSYFPQFIHKIQCIEVKLTNKELLKISKIFKDAGDVIML